MKKFYVPQVIKTTCKINVLGQEVELKIADMAEGCCGCLLAFDSVEAAKRYTTFIGQSANISIFEPSDS